MDGDIFVLPFVQLLKSCTVVLAKRLCTSFIDPINVPLLVETHCTGQESRCLANRCW